MYRSAIGKLRGWLLPEKEEDEEPRRAPRGLEPEVIVHYWDGSVPDARHVRDISDTGAYIYTPERWYLGTIIRILLQGYPKSIREDGTTVPTSSICIPARVVRHGTDGIAVEFIFQDEEEEQRFQKFLAAIPAQPPRTQRPKETSQRKGQALVEFALFIPLVFLLAVTGVTFGGYLFPCLTVATAVRGAALLSLSARTAQPPRQMLLGPAFRRGSHVLYPSHGPVVQPPVSLKFRRRNFARRRLLSRLREPRVTLS